MWDLPDGKNVYKIPGGGPDRYGVGVFHGGEFLMSVYGTSEYKTKEGAERALARRLKAMEG